MSEPEHIKNILPRVMRNIKGRCNRYRKKHGFLLIGEKREKETVGAGKDRRVS